MENNAKNTHETTIVTIKVMEQQNEIATAMKALKNITHRPVLGATIKTKEYGITAERLAKLRQAVRLLEEIDMNENEIEMLVKELLSK
jgi:trehalose utilization protein